MVSTSPTENTHLLNSDAHRQQVPSTSHAALPADPGHSAKKALTSVFVVNFCAQFARSIGMTSKVELFRSFACAEHYGLSRSSSPKAVDCLLEIVDARTSRVIAYNLSLNYLSSCFFALVLSPLFIKRLGYRGCMALGTVLLSLHLCFPILVAELTRETAGSKLFASRHITPTFALYMLLAESLISGVLGSPDMLFEVVSRAIVIDSVPASSRSTWLARLGASLSIGAVTAFLVLQALWLDTRSDLLVDLLPFKIGAAVSICAILASFTVTSLTNRDCTPPSRSSTDTGGQARNTLHAEDEDRGTLNKLRLGLVEAARPLLLLVKPIRNQTTGNVEWSLSRVILAYMLTNQIGIATSTLAVYCPFRFGLHAQELGLMLGFSGAFTFLWLAFAFPAIAKRTRLRFEWIHQWGSEEQEDDGVPAATERFLSITTLFLDAASWLVLAAAGSAANYPLFLLGLALQCMSCPSESTLAALASILCPEGISTENLSATLSFLNNVACTICPVLNSWIYGIGLHAHVPELILIFTSLISTSACILVAATRLPHSILSIHD